MCSDRHLLNVTLHIVANVVSECCVVYNVLRFVWHESVMYGVKFGIYCITLVLIGAPAGQDAFRLYFERRGARRHLLGPLRKARTVSTRGPAVMGVLLLHQCLVKGIGRAREVSLL